MNPWFKTYFKGFSSCPGQCGSVGNKKVIWHKKTTKPETENLRKNDNLGKKLETK